jgi:exodeoxyribonuclease-3
VRRGTARAPDEPRSLSYGARAAPAGNRTLDAMRIATWNVNSIRARVVRTVDFAVREGVDVLLMQEIKCKPEQFPYEAFEAAGYTVEAHGLNQWNGVAIASREPIEDPDRLPGMPGFAKGHDGPDAPQEARAIGATIGGVELWSLYVPNGRGLDDPHYTYKLAWLEALRGYTADTLRAQPDLALALTGDFNIAPTDADNGDPTVVEGVTTHVSPPEREAFQALLDAGLHDTVRPLVPTGYTYWDYKQLRFPATRACASTSSSDRTRSPTPSSRHPSTATSARARSRATTCPSPSTSTSRGRTTTTGR